MGGSNVLDKCQVGRQQEVMIFLEILEYNSKKLIVKIRKRVNTLRLLNIWTQLFISNKQNSTIWQKNTILQFYFNTVNSEN